MIRSTVVPVLLAMLGGGALGLWVGAPSSPHPATPSTSIPSSSSTPVRQQRPVVSPQSVHSAPAVGWGHTGLPFEADV
ncbi:MAG: hypothetical protein HYZ18_09415 [Pseudogulbenkiania sp.]|nr:hypothetical protein [Pseudogulbenkiania sp.]